MRGLPPEPVPGVLLLGGSFDPPTLAHIEMGEEARRLAMPPGSWLVLVPAARSPHKLRGPVANDAQRLEMLDASCAGRERISIWCFEIDRPPPSFWIDTIREARARVQGTLAFVIGADQARSFTAWREPETILSIADPVVLPRGKVRTRADLLRALSPAHPASHGAAPANGIEGAGGRSAEWWSERLIEIEPREASSSRVRALLARHPDSPELERLMHPRVLELARAAYPRT